MDQNKVRIVGTIAFIIIVVIIIYYAYSLYYDYALTNSNTPWLIPTTRIARTSKIIPGYMIKHSQDGRYGIEYSYTFWCFINDIGIYKKGEYKHIFHKGSHDKYRGEDSPYGVMKDQPLLQMPGVWLGKDTNELIVNVNTFSPTDVNRNIIERCQIDNIPINKWFHISIVLINKNLDIYLNGRLKNRCQLDGVPKENYGDLYINIDGGFDGFLSKMRYFNYALPYYMIEQMFNQGPSDKPCIESGVMPPYFRKDIWFENR